jgi:hypothetical protein
MMLMKVRSADTDKLQKSFSPYKDKSDLLFLYSLLAI